MMTICQCPKKLMSVPGDRQLWNAAARCSGILNNCGQIAFGAIFHQDRDPILSSIIGEAKVPNNMIMVHRLQNGSNK
jgi:hypothetical protein